MGLKFALFLSFLSTQSILHSLAILVGCMHKVILKVIHCILYLMVRGPDDGSQVAIPKPEDFQIEFDEQTGHVTRVVAQGNASYRGYIEAHNAAVDMTRIAVEKLIPVAESTGVVIALENVWNNFWVKPKLFANFQMLVMMSKK